MSIRGGGGGGGGGGINIIISYNERIVLHTDPARYRHRCWPGTKAGARQVEDHWADHWTLSPNSCLPSHRNVECSLSSPVFVSQTSLTGFSTLIGSGLKICQKEPAQVT